ncbi:sporulation-delaying protein SdpB family protein [Polaribacter sp.]|uniref:sporulation-delaying protein SdpB family protein n=1 Tax=Polaribacter sp. TaxID=1920175 RepID=UPI003EFA4EAD
MNKLNKILENLTLKNFPYTNVIGLARSIIAFGTLMTLLFNSYAMLVYENSKYGAVKTFGNFQFNFFTLFGQENFVIMKWLAIAILLVTISGFFIKITAILHWWISLSFLYFCSLGAVEGGDKIAANITFLLIPILLTDKRKNHWHYSTPYKSANTIFALFAVWAIRIQIAIVYFHTSIAKMFVQEWSDGTYLYYLFNSTIYGMPRWISPFMNVLLENSIALSLLTYGALLLEILLVLGLTASIKYRKIVLVFAILFHFSIIFFTGIFTFFFAISGGLILFLYPTFQTINFNLNRFKKVNQ